MNSLRQAILDGRTLTGLWQNLPGPVAAEIARDAGFDWLMLDGEHGPWDPADLRARLIAAPEAAVRVPVNEAWVIKQALDLGARTVLVPMVDSAAEAEGAVAACRYPPQGHRGVGAMVARAGRWGQDPGYTARANDTVSVWVQAESRAALADLEAICAVPGVDCVFLGPADLAADMGLPPTAPQVRAALEDAIARIAAAGCAPGIFGGVEADHWIRRGARVVAVGSDGMVLAAGLKALRP